MKLKAWDKELKMFHDEVVRIDFRMNTIVVFSKSEDDYPSPDLPLDRFELSVLEYSYGTTELHSIVDAEAESRKVDHS